MEPSLTTSQLAARTGVAAGTLRMWEARYGFPVPVILQGGHHRYAEREVEAVRDVVRLRGEGFSMAAAVARVRATDKDVPTSIYAALRRRRPDLRPLAASKRALLALTHAIEDEHCAHAGAGVMIGSFQRVRHYRAAEPRWRELARTPQLAIAIADFPALRVEEGVPAEVPVAADHQLGREWTLIVNSGEAKACLSAWELPRSSDVPDLARRFEVVWSFDPETVHDATVVAAALIADVCPPVAARMPDLGWPPGPSSPELRFAADVASRAFGYLAAQLDASDT
jgi:DICT domain-containing protein